MAKDCPVCGVQLVLLFVFSFLLLIYLYYHESYDVLMYAMTDLLHKNESFNTQNSTIMKFMDPWIEIPSNELTSHFTKYELSSMIQDSNTNLKCDVDYNLQYCCIGSISSGGSSGWNHDSRCTKRNFKIKLKYYNKRKAQSSHDIFWKLKNNSNIIIIGDSVQNQIVNGFECDIIRNNHYPFNFSYVDTSKIYLKYALRKDVNMSLLVSNWTQILNDPNYIKLDFRYKLAAMDCIKNTTFFGYKYDGNNRRIKHIVHVLFIRAFRPYIPMYIEKFCKWGNVYLFSWDLHYFPGLNDTDWYKEIGNGIFKIIQNCLDRYKELENKPIFIWNEVSAQHFGKIGGDYFDIYRFNFVVENVENVYREYISYIKNDTDFMKDNTKWRRFIDSVFRFQNGIECEPHHFLKNKSWENHVRRIRMMSFLNDKRNHISFNTEMIHPNKPIDHFSSNTLYYLPFKDITDPLWNMHRGGDCTHWCTTPYLWQILWDSMYRIIDKNYPQ